MKRYLESSEYIDWQTPAVFQQAKTLSQGLRSKEDIARSCFIFVRDQIKHSLDYKMNPVTLKASEVLKFGTGYCYAKSHLLAGLLRANEIPAALCYQRLTFTDDKPPFCIHGLNAIYLEEYGWFRVDARGNKEGVHAGFDPPHEVLAFDTKVDGELDYEDLYVSPVPSVVSVLAQYNDFQAVADHLPDTIDSPSTTISSIEP